MNKQYYQSRTGFITQSALIAALYVVLTMIVAPIVSRFAQNVTELRAKRN